MGPVLKLPPNQTARAYSRPKQGIRVLSSHNLMDPGEMPAHLHKLTQIEEVMIFKVITIMRIYKIRKNHSGYSGHVISFPQDVVTFARNFHAFSPMLLQM